MKATKYIDQEIILKRGIDALMKELGPVDAVRFINIPREKRIESVKRHRAWQQQLDMDKFFDEVFG